MGSVRRGDAMDVGRRRARRLGGWLVALAAAGLVLAAAGLVVLRLVLDAAVEDVAAAALAASPSEERVEALIRLASSEDAPLERRNRAVWALGQLRDERALPALARLEVQQACDHDRLVCQREVRKARAKIRGELSLRHSLRTAWHRLRGRIARPSAHPDAGTRPPEPEPLAQE